MIEIFDDRVQISNPGGLPKGLTPEKFGTRSISRNPIISSLLHRAGYIEKMGTGINRIRDALKESGNPGPIFEFDSFFTITFQRSIKTDANVSVAANLKMSGKSSRKTSGKKSLKTSRSAIITPIKTLKSSGKSSEKTSGKILALIKQNSLSTIPELAKQTGVTERSVERNIQKLQRDELLKRLGPAKGGHWKVIET